MKFIANVEKIEALLAETNNQLKHANRLKAIELMANVRIRGVDNNLRKFEEYILEMIK